MSPPADAHALLVSSDPADGASLSSSPRTVTLTFTEEPDVKLSSVRVLDTSGGSHEQGELSVMPGRARSVDVAIGELERGVYTVSWRVVSRVDGHHTSGAFAFGVGVAPSEIEAVSVEPTRSPPLSPFEVAGRFLFFVGLAVLVGWAWVGAFLVAQAPRALAFAGLGLAGGGVVLLSAAQKIASAADWRAFAGSPIGRALVGRAILLGVAFLAVTIPSRWARLAALGSGIATIGFHTSAGHAATGAFATVKVGTQLVHFAAMAIWIGGLAAVLSGTRGAPDDKKARAVKRFSAVAGVMLAVVVGTGTARAVAEVGSWSGLVGTSYGRLVIVKVGLVGVITALAARNRWWNVPRGADGLGSVRRTSRAELGTALVLLAVTGVLASLVPARSVSLAEPASLALEGTDFARSVRVRLAVTPGYPGGNEFVAEVEPLRGDAEIDGVVLRLSSEAAGIRAAQLALRKDEERWRARGSVVAVQGAWRVTVVVDRGADSAEVPLEFHTRCRANAPTTDDKPRIYDIEIAGGKTAQAYVDPGAAGRNEVHFTFFDDQGKELAMADDPRIDGFRERSRTLDVRRFSSGHFVAGATLDKGQWIFSFDGSTADGEGVSVCFSDDI